MLCSTTVSLIAPIAANTLPTITTPPSIPSKFDVHRNQRTAEADAFGGRTQRFDNFFVSAMALVTKM
jgi:hypothetical protein